MPCSFALLNVRFIWRLRSTMPPMMYAFESSRCSITLGLSAVRYTMFSLVNVSCSYVKYVSGVNSTAQFWQQHFARFWAIKDSGFIPETISLQGCGYLLLILYTYASCCAIDCCSRLSINSSNSQSITIVKPFWHNSLNISCFYYLVKTTRSSPSSAFLLNLDKCTTEPLLLPGAPDSNLFCFFFSLFFYFI